MPYSYIIASGWWSTKKEEDSRAVFYGDDSQRTVDFHRLWLTTINRFCKPKEILIIDSASPLKPKKNHEEKWIEMADNFGHSTNHIGKYSGVTRSFIMSLTYSYLNDYDYWVYIEQDCLVYGENIAEIAIKSMKHDIMFGDGSGTPQPMQQSFMIIKRAAIPMFIHRLQKIDATDNEISPEIKFILATSFLIDLLPSHLMGFLLKRLVSLKGKFIFFRNVFFRCHRLFCKYDNLPFSGGRVRPIPFDDTHFYFQHGSQNELDLFIKKIADKK